MVDVVEDADRDAARQCPVERRRDGLSLGTVEPDVVEREVERASGSL